jgi:membrane associated rhomboid family serine protease
MIPIRQTLPRKGRPIVNEVLVAVNCLVFAVQLLLGSRTEMLINTFGFIPARMLHPAAYGYSMLEVCITLLTSLFLHGGLVHLLGNMIYLWTFGGPVEETLGRGRYALFYVTCGVIGSLTHTVFFSQSQVASIGASGSIAGVLGAFLVLRPRARIVTLFPLVVYWAMAEVRAMLFLPVWFGLQFFNGALALSAAQKTSQVAGVAWWAHVGGFLFGAVVGAVVRMRRAAV